MRQSHGIPEDFGNLIIAGGSPESFGAAVFSAPLFGISGSYGFWAGLLHANAKASKRARRARDIFS